jgi:cytidine deaminase
MGNPIELITLKCYNIHMSERALEPGDRPDFIEGWHDLRMLRIPSDRRFHAVQSLAYIIDLSQQAIDKLGESYRGFRVGAAALVEDELGGRIGVYFQGNYTPYEGAEWNCAEKRLLESIKEKGFTKIRAIAISGPLQQDAASGIISSTLHPCHKCRGLFQESDLVDDDTLVATSNPETNSFELFTVRSLRLLHETGQPQPFPDDYHPYLIHFWNQILSYDPEEEAQEAAFMKALAAESSRTG